MLVLGSAILSSYHRKLSIKTNLIQRRLLWNKGVKKQIAKKGWLNHQQKTNLHFFETKLITIFNFWPWFWTESDGYSGGTDSKTTASSKATLELYETTTNGTKPSTVSLNHLSLGGHHNGGSSNGGGSSSNNSNNNNHHKGGITETSLSGGEDELISNKSEDRFSGQTDYEMVSKFYNQKWSILNNFFFTFSQEIPPASMMTGFDHHHHPHHPLSMLPNGLHIQTSLPHHGTMRGMSTYLLDESTTTAVSNHHQQMAAMSATSPMHSQQQQQQQQFQQQYHHQFHPPLPTSTTTLRYSSLGMSPSVSFVFVSPFYSPFVHPRTSSTTLITTSVFSPFLFFFPRCVPLH